MQQPTFLTLSYKGYFILTDTLSPEVTICAEGYGIIGRARTVRGAKCKITRTVARGEDKNE